MIPPLTDETDCGAVNGAFPLWAAREAKETIIKRLDAQTATLAGYEARATSLLGWLSGIVIAVLSTGAARLIGPSAGALSRAQVAVLMLAALIPAFFSAISLAVVYRPKTWYPNFGDIDWLTTHIPENPSELEVLQSFADAARESVMENDRTLARAFGALTSGRRWFLAVPACAGLTCLVLAALAAAEALAA